MNRLNRSLDNLLTTIEELQRERDHLAAALNHIIRGVIHLEKCDVLTSPQELIDHIEDFESAWIILIKGRPRLGVRRKAYGKKISYASGPPIAVPWIEIRAMEEAGTLKDWIEGNWSEFTQAIAIPGLSVL